MKTARERIVHFAVLNETKKEQMKKWDSFLGEGIGANLNE